MLKKYSNDIDILLSGNNYSLKPSVPIKYKNKGITFSINNGKIDYLKTLVNFDLFTSYLEQKEIPFKNLFYEMMEFIDDVVDPLGSRKQIDYLETMLRNGTSADRQLNEYKKNNDLNDVVDSLVSETLEGC